MLAPSSFMGIASLDFTGEIKLFPPLIFLKKISSLSLPLLSSLTLKGLNWTSIIPDLQRELIVLISQRQFKDIRLSGSQLPEFPWVRFVSPTTRSLRLQSIKIGVGLVASPDSQSVTSFDDIPVHLAPNLTNLDAQGLRRGEVIKWILQLFKVPGHRNIPSTSTAFPVHGCSWRESITTLSLQRCVEADSPFKLIQECSSLKRVDLSFYNSVTQFPFYEVMRHPTLEYVYIETPRDEAVSWVISSFKPTIPSSQSLYRTAAMKTKTVFINMSIYNLPRSASTLYRPSVPEILIKVRELDDIISCIPNVEVNLEIFVRFELMDDEEQLEYEQTKTMLAGLLADTTALKLKVTCSRALVDACPQWDIFVSP